MVGTTQAGNLQLSAAVYFAGASFLKLDKVIVKGLITVYIMSMLLLFHYISVT